MKKIFDFCDGIYRRAEFLIMIWFIYQGIFGNYPVIHEIFPYWKPVAIGIAICFIMPRVKIFFKGAES